MPRQQRLPATTRRRQLLDVALPLFGARGFHDTSMEDIAERAGVTKPVVYQHFESKRSLYRELLESVGEDLVAVVSERAITEAAPKRRVQSGFEAYFRWVGEHPSAFGLLFGGSARQEDDSAEVVREIEDRMATVVGKFIEAAVEPDHQELLGYGIVGLAEITARQWVARHGDPRRTPTSRLDPAEGDRLARRLGDLVWAGLRSLPGSNPSAV